MQKRRAIIPQLESMEGRVVPSTPGSHLIHSASVELHRLGKDLNNTYHTIRHNLQAHSANQATQVQGTNHRPIKTQGVPHVPHTTQSKSPFQSFFDSIKSAFKF